MNLSTRSVSTFLWNPGEDDERIMFVSARVDSITAARILVYLQVFAATSERRSEEQSLLSSTETPLEDLTVELPVQEGDGAVAHSESRTQKESASTSEALKSG